MEARFIRWIGVSIAAAALLAQPAAAGDRKGSTQASHESRASAMMNQPIVAPTMLPRTDRTGRHSDVDDPFSFGLIGNGVTKVARPDHGGANAEQKETEPTPPHARKSLTFFHISSKAGDIAVQPVVGAVKGAQFSLRF